MPPFTAQEMRERFSEPGSLVAYLDAQDAAAQPAREPWLHRMVRNQHENWDNAGPLYPNCCCADTHLQFQRKGALYLAVAGGLAWAAWRVWKKRR